MILIDGSISMSDLTEFVTHLCFSAAFNPRSARSTVRDHDLRPGFHDREDLRAVQLGQPCVPGAAPSLSLLLLAVYA